MAGMGALLCGRSSQGNQHRRSRRNALPSFEEALAEDLGPGIEIEEKPDCGEGFVPGLAHLILCGTSGWALQNTSFRKYPFAYGSFAFLLGHGCIGILKAGHPAVSSFTDAVYTMTEYIANCAVVPLMSSQIQIMHSFAQSRVLCTFFSGLIPLLESYVTPDARLALKNVIVLSNIGTLIYVAEISSNDWAVYLAALSIFNHFILPPISNYYGMSQSVMQTIGIAFVPIVASCCLKSLGLNQLLFNKILRGKMSRTNYFTSFVHLILAITCGWALHNISNATLMENGFAVGAFALLLGHGLCGFLRYGHPDANELASFVYGCTSKVVKSTVLPLINTQLYFDYKMSKEIAYAHIMSAPLEMVTQKIHGEHKTGVSNMVEICNIISCAFLSVIQLNYWGLGLAAVSTINAFVFESAATEYDVPRKDLEVMGYTFFVLFAVNAISS